MPKFNKITHYCVIGTVLKVSKSSQELNTSTFFFLYFFFFFFSLLLSFFFLSLPLCSRSSELALLIYGFGGAKKGVNITAMQRITYNREDEGGTKTGRRERGSETERVKITFVRLPSNMLHSAQGWFNPVFPAADPASCVPLSLSVPIPLKKQTNRR